MFPPKSRILCVDGSDDICEMLQFLLEPLGYEVRSAYNLTEAMRLAEQERFALYLIAHKLREGDGIEVCRRLREFDSQTPILFWSALVFEADRQSALRAGATVFLRKPEDVGLLPATIAQLIRDSRARS